MKKKIRLLAAPADREKLAPILEALGQKGASVTETGTPGKDDTVLAVLTESFYADETLCRRLLELLAAGAERVLPLQLDGGEMPDTLKNALYSRNILSAAGREAGHTAQRILDALPKRKTKLPLILTAGAVALAAVIGLLIWQGIRNRETVPAMAEQEIWIPSVYGLTQEGLDKAVMASFISDRFNFLTREDLEQGGYPNPATYHMEDDGMHWDSTEDGHRLSMAR